MHDNAPIFTEKYCVLFSVHVSECTLQIQPPFPHRFRPLCSEVISYMRILLTPRWKLILGSGPVLEAHLHSVWRRVVRWSVLRRSISNSGRPSAIQFRNFWMVLLFLSRVRIVGFCLHFCCFSLHSRISLADCSWWHDPEKVKWSIWRDKIIVMDWIVGISNIAANWSIPQLIPPFLGNFLKNFLWYCA